MTPLEKADRRPQATRHAQLMGQAQSTRHAFLKTSVVAAVGALALGLALPAAAGAVATGAAATSATADPLPPGAVALPPPALLGVAPVPGAVAAAAQPSPNMGILDVSPDQGVAGSPMAVSGSHLPANAKVELTWSTANVTWLLDPEADTVNYLGRDETKFSTVLATTTTDKNGHFQLALKAPQDWGGVHDIYAVIGGQEVAHGGFITLRSLTVTPLRGPIGTPITITYSGLGASEYEGGGALLYDNHFVGEMMANWTRGVARVTIRASGPVGAHIIEVGDAVDNLYLNLPQSTLPYAKGGTARFVVTGDDGRPPPSIDWPVKVGPTVTDVTTLKATGLAQKSPVTAHLATTSGQVGSSVELRASGVTAGGPVQLVWSTVVGNRINCHGVCWAFVSQTLATATPAGGSLHALIKIPDGLGGWHVVQLVQGRKVLSQVPFYVEESIVGRGVSSLVVKEGQAFSVHLKGVGWTQLDNTVAVDYDNSYVGYGCGFNSNGDVVLNLHATGGPGTHLIDIYPVLYTLSPSFANTPFGMLPVLTYQKDEPGLALGYKLPAIRLAVTVVN